MNIGIYARISTSNRGQDVDLQLRELREYCQRRGWTIIREYVDRGVSGAKSSRPQLDKLMADAANHKFDAVLVWKLDRFGRSVLHLTNAIATLESYGVAFVSLRDNLDLTTPAGRLMFNVLASMAQFERDLISERVKAGMANAKAKGRHVGRPSLGVSRDAVVGLRNSGSTWEQVSSALGASVSTLKSVYANPVENAAL